VWLVRFADVFEGSWRAKKYILVNNESILPDCGLRNGSVTSPPGNLILESVRFQVDFD